MKNTKQDASKAKPYLTGKPTDENTVKSALKFFGILLLVMLMTFLVSSVANVDNNVIRIIINVMVESIILLIFYSKGADQGTEAVARGEILYQHIEKGQDVAESERRIPFHRAKGYLIGLAGSVIFLVLALVFLPNAQKQMVGSGMLPSWMESYMRRTEVGPALVQYTQASPVTFADILRLIVRLSVMPFISIAGTENKDLLLLMEKLSPLLVLLPAISFGTGYLQGPARRTLIHTEIAKNTKRRISRERKARKARAAREPKGPEQLN